MDLRSISVILAFSIYLMCVYYAVRYSDLLNNNDRKSDSIFYFMSGFLCQEIIFFQVVVFTLHNHANYNLANVLFTAIIIQLISAILLKSLYAYKPSSKFFETREERIRKSKAKHSSIIKRSNQTEKLILAILFQVTMLTILLLLYSIIKEKSNLFNLLFIIFLILSVFIMLLPAIFIKCPQCKTKWFLIFDRKIARHNLWADTPPKCPICGW